MILWKYQQNNIWGVKSYKRGGSIMNDGFQVMSDERDFYSGTTEKERKKYDKNFFIEFRDKYKNGEVSQNEYTSFFIRYLINLVRSTIKDVTGLNSSADTYEQLISECNTIIIEQVEEYDPQKGAPSTFFIPYIRKGILKYISKDENTDYYNTTITSLNKIAREKGFDGINDSRLSIQYLSIISGERLSTIIKVKELAGYSKISMESEGLDKKYKSITTPEMTYIAKESKSELLAAIEECTPLEQFLLETKAKGITMRSVLFYLKQPENITKFRDEITEKVSQATLQNMLTKAEMNVRRRLERPKKNKGNMPKKYDNELKEQAIIQDFIDGFCD